MANRRYVGNRGFLSDDWLNSLWDSMLGTGFFGDFWSEDVANGNVFSPTDFASMQYEMNKISQQQDWSEMMFNQYQSIPAQVQQMRQAGLNPALMYGSGASVSSPVSGTASGGAPSGRSPQFGSERAQQIVSTLLSLLGAGGSVASQLSGIKRNSVQNELTEAQTEAEFAGIDKTRAETDNILLKNKWQEVENEFQRAYKSIGLEETASRINNLNASAAKLFSDVNVNNSVIEVNGHRIQLISSEISRNEAEAYLSQMRAFTERLTQEQVRIITSYQEELSRAQVSLMEAQSDSVRQQARTSYTQAQLNLIEYLKQEQLMDAGYIEQVIKGMKTQRGTAIANTVINGVTSVANAVVDFTPLGLVRKSLD